MLRQSVRFCVDEEANVRKYKTADALRPLLPKLLDQYKLVDRARRRPPPGRRLDRPDGDDDLRVAIDRRRPTPSPRPWPRGSRPRPSARRSRWPPTSSSSTTRAARRTSPGSRRAASTAPRSASTPPTRPTPGGTSPASATAATRCASLIVGAYHTAGQAGGLNPQPYPLAEHRESVRDVAPGDLLAEAEDGDRGQRPGPRLRPGPPLRRARRRGAAGRSTCCSATRSARTAPCTPRSITGRSPRSSPRLARPSAGGTSPALARVTASEYGHPAPGVADARRLLGV